MVWWREKLDLKKQFGPISRQDETMIDQWDGGITDAVSQPGDCDSMSPCLIMVMGWDSGRDIIREATFISPDIDIEIMQGKSLCKSVWVTNKVQGDFLLSTCQVWNSWAVRKWCYLLCAPQWSQGCRGEGLTPDSACLSPGSWHWTWVPCECLQYLESRAVVTRQAN